MQDDPQVIAAYLVRKDGLEAARRQAIEGIARSHQKGDLYAVSVWREVRRVLSKDDKFVQPAA